MVNLQLLKLKTQNSTFKFQKQLDEACAYLGLETLSIGYDPITALQNSPNNPKKRYKVMTKEMPKKGKLSLEMMYQTCGTQINLDYSSEEDFTKKFKIISFLTPLTVALFSNSAVKQGDPTGYLSYRTKVWQNTSRAGLPDFFLDEVTFEKYAAFVLNFPLLFYYKNNEYNFPMGKTYKDLVSHEEANSENLELHLSTIFTELRLKKYIELRSLDACEWDCHCAGPAFFTGLLYGNLDETFEVIKDWNKDEIKNAYAESCKKGLRTEINNKDILFWSIKLLQISKKGLEKRSYLNENKKNESVFLKNIENILKNNLTKAEEYLNNFKK